MTSALSRIVVVGSNGRCACFASIRPVATALLTRVRLQGAVSVAAGAVVAMSACWASTGAADDQAARAPRTRTCLLAGIVELRSKENWEGRPLGQASPPGSGVVQAPMYFCGSASNRGPQPAQQSQ